LEIQSHIENAQTERRRLSEQLLTLRENQQAETHFADDLRASLRNLGEELNSQDAALSELEKRLTEERSLRAEILSTKFKLSRLNTASSILSGMKFDSCPQCGTQVGDRDEMPNQCTLCTSNLEVQNSHVAQREDLAQKDLDARLVDIEDSIK
jgi:DNA repair exonuclease SbcCD ATPase subunit